LRDWWLVVGISELETWYSSFLVVVVTFALNKFKVPKSIFVVVFAIRNLKLVSSFSTVVVTLKVIAAFA